MKYLKFILTLIGGFLGWFIGSCDGFILTLIVFAVIDYITGVLDAYFKNELSSEIGFKGIIRKVVIFAVVGVANVLDVYIIKNGSVLRTATVFFYASNEGISILENLTSMGVPIPRFLKKALKQLKDNDPLKGEEGDANEV